jgi:hypothetical protein
MDYDYIEIIENLSASLKSIAGGSNSCEDWDLAYGDLDMLLQAASRGIAGPFNELKKRWNLDHTRHSESHFTEGDNQVDEVQLMTIAASFLPRG